MRPRTWIGLLLIGTLSAAGCGDDSDDTTPAASVDTTPVASTAATATGPTATAASTAAPPSDDQPDKALFAEPFEDDRNGWGVVDDPEFGSAAFAGGDYVWEFSGRVAHWLPAVLGDQYDRGELDMLDVVVRAEVTVQAGGGVVGVFCRESPDTDADWQWYEFVVRDGYAAIRQADTEGNIDALAETDDARLPGGEPITIEAACVDDANGDARLSLTLNDTLVLDATDDDPLGNGVAGLQAWTFPPHEQMDIRWHEFSVHQPEA